MRVVSLNHQVEIRCLSFVVALRKLDDGDCNSIFFLLKHAITVTLNIWFSCDLQLTLLHKVVYSDEPAVMVSRVYESFFIP